MSRLPRALLVTAALALLARLALMVVRGDYLVYDEAYYLLLARSLRQHGTFQLNGLPHVALSPLQPLLVAALSLAGMPDLLASRGLTVLSGALLPVAVWAVAVRLMPARPALVAAVLVAAASTLMTFTPFFPGRSWNLYFGSEPIYLLATFGALAAAMRAAASGSARWFVFTGLSAGAAFLARAEGLVLGPLLFAAVGLFLVLDRRRAWGAWSLGVLVALTVSAPYLGYLRAALGRWALSGRVQAVTAGPAPRVESTARRGGAVLDDFVWGGDEARFREELYRLTPEGDRMRSQYWGVERRRTGAPQSDQGRPEATAGDQKRPEATNGEQRRSFARSLWRGMTTVVPPWFLVLAGVGIARVTWLRDRRLVWLVPPLLAVLIPAWAAYVEPRVLLPLVPLCALGAAGLWHELDGRLRARAMSGRWAAAAAAVVSLLLAWPAARDGWRASHGTTDLQRVASAQRAVGTLLNQRLAPAATVMSWHPAVAVWARRDWRVLPLEPLGRVVPYARARGVTALVLSRFHPSPLARAPRPFTVLLLDGPEPPPVGDNVTLSPVEDGALVFVGRLAPRP